MMKAEKPKLEKEIKKFCSRIGQNPLFVQGAGGNISWKDDNTLWIKASGKWIAKAETEEIFVPVNLKTLLENLKKNNFSVKPQISIKSLLRPSIETFLHALLPHKIVLHIHAVEILSYLVKLTSEKEIRTIYGDKNNWIYLNYFKPGEELAIALAKKLNINHNIDVIFMENHGIVIGSDNLKNLEALLQNLTSEFKTETRLKPINYSYNENISVLLDYGYLRCKNEEINHLSLEKSFANRLKHEWALYPDHVVFLGKNAAILESNFTYAELFELIKHNPPFIFVIDNGVYESPNIKEYHRAQLLCYYDVIIRQKKSDKLKVLNSKEIKDLLNWDAETHRQNLQ